MHNYVANINKYIDEISIKENSMKLNEHFEFWTA